MIHGLSTVGMVGPIRSRFIKTGTITIKGSLITVPNLATSIPLITKGVVSQSANLQEWQNNTTTLVSISSIGAIKFNSTNPNMLLTNAGRVAMQQNSAGTAITFGSGGGDVGDFQFYAANGYRLSVSTNGVSIGATAGGSFAYGGVLNILGPTVAKVTTATDVVYKIEGASGQSGNLTEWRDNSSTLLARVLAAGTAEFGGLFFGDIGFGSTYPAIKGLTAGINDYALLTALDGATVALNAKATTGTVDIRIGNSQKFIVAASTITVADAMNIVLNTTTGTKWGTGTTQKQSWWNSTPVVQSTGWTTSNVSSDKVMDANATSIDELADVLGTLIDTLKTYGLLGA